MRSTDFPFAVMPQRFDKGGGRPDYSAPSAALAAVRADDDQQFGGISSRDASVRDQIKDKLAVIVGRRNANKLMSVGELLGVDAPLMLDEARLAYREGRPGEAAATAALAVLPIPGAAKKGAKAAVKKVASLKPAVRVGGKVYSSVADHLSALSQIPDEEVRALARADGDNRGFINDRGRFMDRFRAQEYAVANGLLSPNAPAWAKTSPDLISENLLRYDAQLEQGALNAAKKVTKGVKPLAALDKSELSRMARADEQNYMSDRFWHGRDAPSQYEPKDTTTFYSRDPEYAAGFARDGGSVYEYRIRPQKMMPAGKVNFGTAADIIEGLIKAEDESGAVRVMSGLVDFPGTPQQFVAAARRAPENSLGVSAAAIQHLLSKNANTTWESALRSAGFDAYDTGRDVVMLTRKGQRRVDAAFDPEQIEETGVTKARGGLAVFKDKTPFAVRG